MPRTRFQMNGDVLPPWDDWKLDRTFFKSLSQYSTNHPETTLVRVLDSISTGLENNRPLIDLIPDTPFPARGLVGALAHLIKLGVTVTRAKATVAEFSHQVLAWIIDIKCAFESSVGGHFTWTTWKNLEKMRDLIDEICRWANARLNDKLWSRIGNGMMIANQISEFNTRIVEAKGLFTDLTIINLSGGIDAILGAIRILLQRQDHIDEEIQKIKEKQREQFAYILDEMEAQKQTEARRLFLSKTLSSRTVANPTYDQQGKQPCDEDTRTEVLADIMNWVNDTSPSSQNFLWLTGDPGCGKSAITASIARESKDRGILWAQFFINRNNVETTDPNSYFPSIARQLMDHSIDVELAIHDSLQRKPSLTDRISPDQAAMLFIDAIAIASELQPRQPVVVVIDGLDETDRGRLKDTAIIFSHLFQGLSRHRNAKVFISSRTEDDIRNPFARNMDHKHVKHIHLDTAAQSSIDDVSFFLRRKIVQIVEENDLNWAEWPGDERMAVLALRASGLFIWAVTVAKFLQEQIDTMGTECLNDVLDMLNAEALGDINTLYGVILRLTYKEQASSWESEKFRRVVGAIVVLREPLCLEALSSLLNLRQTDSSSPVDIVNFVRRLRTVLVAGTQAVDKTTIPRLHKSFFEFITSHQVDSRFRVNPKVADGELGVQCLRQFQAAHAITNAHPLSTGALSGQFRYASRFWSVHLDQAGGESDGVIIQDTSPLMQTEFRDLLRHSSNDLQVEPLHITFSHDQSRVFTSSRDHVHAWDMASGLKMNSKPNILNGHTDYVTAVAFSPDSTRLVSGSRDSAVILWDVKSSQAITTFKGHTHAVHCVKFSPIGNYIASCSEDCTIRVWDAYTCLPLASLTGHTGPVRSITFSPSGKQIVSGSDDKTVRVWDLQVHPIGRILSGHKRPVMSVTFSPDGNVIISSSLDNTVRLWDAEEYYSLGEPLRFPDAKNVEFSQTGSHFAAVRGPGDDICVWEWKGSIRDLRFSENIHRSPTTRIWCMALSLDGKQLILGGGNHCIRVVESDSGRASMSPLFGHNDRITSVAASPDGKHVASGSADKTIRIWDKPIAPVGGQAYDDAGKTFTSFSPDGTLVVSASPTLHLWDSKSPVPLNKPLCGKMGQMRYIAFSPDRSRIAAVSSQSAIYLWDVKTCGLIASSVTDFISQVNSLSFTADSRCLVTTYTDAPSNLWEERHGKLVGANASDGIKSIPQGITTEFFDLDDSQSGDTNHHLRGVRWFPDKTSGSGVWAFLDDHIIRAREDGSITVVPVSFQKMGLPIRTPPVS